MTETALRTENPKSYLSEEERESLFREGGEHLVCIAESDAADEAGDDEAGWQWLAKAKLTTVNLKLLKKWYGADFIRERGFDTTNADKELGVGWLDS